MANFVPAELIKKKREGSALSAEEIQFFISAYTDGNLPDYQMSALLMAVFFRGMGREETLALTKSMLHSGSVADFSEVPGFKVDKHSTGGVGDKTTLILGPIVAACGLKVPSISGRGLGHTGGTLDKLESIPGFQIQRTPRQFVEQTRDHGICFIGQTTEICPADRKIYALRDVTATVESLPLICASILSKKLAEGIDGLVLDVKYGSGAFMKTLAQAEELAQLLMSVAKLYGKKVSALLTNMNEPLGRFAGNSLEIQESVDILSNVRHPMTEDTRELSLQLSAHMLLLSGNYADLSVARRAAEDTLNSGKALAKFHELCSTQGGNLAALPAARGRHVIRSTEDGFISAFDTENIGYAGVLLKAGRLKSADKIEPTAGIEFHKKISDPVRKGEALFTIHCDNPQVIAAASDRLSGCVTSSLQKPTVPALISKTLT